MDNDGRRPAVEVAVDLRCSLANILFSEKLVSVVNLVYNSGRLIYSVLFGLQLNAYKKSLKFRIFNFDICFKALCGYTKRKVDV